MSFFCLERYSASIAKILKFYRSDACQRMQFSEKIKIYKKQGSRDSDAKEDARLFRLIQSVSLTGPVLM